MDVALVFHRGDFDPRNDAHANRCPRLTRLLESGDGVVVGHRDRRQAGFGSTVHQLAWRQETIRSCRVKVEIDHC
jgi:hypothetical protein